MFRGFCSCFVLILVIFFMAISEPQWTPKHFFVFRVRLKSARRSRTSVRFSTPLPRRAPEPPPGASRHPNAPPLFPSFEMSVLLYIQAASNHRARWPTLDKTNDQPTANSNGGARAREHRDICIRKRTTSHPDKERGSVRGAECIVGCWITPPFTTTTTMRAHRSAIAHGT